MSQISFFDLIPDKQVLITYRDRYGVVYREKAPIYDNYLRTVSEWREAHKDCYFIRAEEV